MATTNTALKNDYAALDLLPAANLNAVADAIEKAAYGSISVAHDNTANFDLTDAQDANPILIITGALTAARNLVLRTAAGARWFVVNSTTGGFSLTAKTSAGAGIAIPAGYGCALRCDGTDIVATGPLVTAAGAVSIIGALAVSGALTVTGALTLQADSTLSDGVDLSLGVTNGTKIGTATTQKLGFFNSAPVVKPAALTAADATAIDAAYDAVEQGVLNNVRTRLNEIESRLQSLGLLS